MVASAHSSKGSVAGGGTIKSERVDGAVTIAYFPEAEGSNTDATLPSFHAEVLDAYRLYFA